MDPRLAMKYGRPGQAVNAKGSMSHFEILLLLMVVFLAGALIFAIFRCFKTGCKAPTAPCQPPPCQVPTVICAPPPPVCTPCPGPPYCYTAPEQDACCM